MPAKRGPLRLPKHEQTHMETLRPSDGAKSAPATSARRTTIKEVAKLAGVSLMTVSRAINYPEQLSAKTLAIVNEAIDATGYIPNRLAGSLSGSRTGQVAVLVPSLSNLVFSDLLNGMAYILEPRGIQMMVGNYHYLQTKLAEQIPLFMGWSPDAMVIVGSVPASVSSLLRKNGLPVVETVGLVDNPFDCNVGISHQGAGAAMADYLMGMGYRRMACISANAGLEYRTTTRILGFCEYLTSAGYPLPPHIELPCRSSIAAGRSAMKQLLDSGPLPEAVFCANDDLAFGAMMACTEAELRVPDDVGIAGFNALDIALQSIPSITTVKVDRYGIGVLSAQMILGRLSGDIPRGECRDVGYEIIPGGSTVHKEQPLPEG